MIKYNNIQFFPILFLILISGRFLSQEPVKLNVGDKSPNLVLTSTNNSVQSFNFPYQNKIVLLFFWSSSVSKSKENIYKYKRLFSKYSELGFKDCDGFDLISVALQSDKVAWEQDLKKYNLLKANNCISQKGYSDFFVKGFKISQTPSSFLIDELGKIVFVNPTIKEIISYLNEKRNNQLSIDTQSKLVGKILFGNEKLSPLTNEKISILNEKLDTIQSVILDSEGLFTFKNINASSSIKFVISNTSKIKEDEPVFINSLNDEIVSSFTKTDLGFENELLDVEMPYLKPLVDNDPIVKPIAANEDLKDLYKTEFIFKTKAIVLTKDGFLKLDEVIKKLKENPNTRLDIISHTDSKGESKANSSLTMKQSAVISNYLISKGISKKRIKGIEKGESEIINKCKDGVICTEQEHCENRRIEFKFYKL